MLLETLRGMLPWRPREQGRYRRFQESELEREVSEVLQRGIFGEKEFEEFVDFMILLREKTDKKGSSAATVIDLNQYKRIDLSKGKSSAGSLITFQNAVDDNGHHVYESLRYKLDWVTTRRRPYLTSTNLIIVPPLDIRHESFIGGDLGEAFPNRVRLSEKEQFLSDDKAKSLCLKTFNLYLALQNKPPQSQNSVG